MKTKYKLIAADMDGTLLNDDKIITQKNISAIKTAINDGVIFAFATGRPPQAIIPYRSLITPVSPIIAYNGAMIIDKSDNIIFNCTLTPEQSRLVLKYADKYDTTACIWAGNRLYVNKLNERTEKYRLQDMTEPKLLSSESRESIIENGITKILWYDTKERTPRFYEALKDDFKKYDIEVCPSTTEYLEFFNIEVSKGLSLKRLACHLNIKREEIMAFGDNFNDLDMIKYAGAGIAMSNSPDEIKKAADFVTLSNNDDGVAYAIYKLLY